MPQGPLIAATLITLVGALIAFQAPINAGLSRAVDSSVAAATISFGIGFVVLSLITLFSGDGPAFAKVATAPRWLLIGGLLGAVYVWSALWVVPILGVLTTTLLLILGQMTASLILDHIGAFGLPVRDISVQRVLSILLVGAGAFLSRF